ncbi:MAG: hypothetical protein V3R57_06290 [Candidatus Bathyarchaeia archaeon]
MRNDWEKHIGKKYGMLTIISRTLWYSKPAKRRNRLYKVQCDCGGVGYFPIMSMRNGHRKSCGCLKKHLDKNRSPYLRYMKDNGMEI